MTVFEGKIDDGLFIFYSNFPNFPSYSPSTNSRRPIIGEKEREGSKREGSHLVAGKDTHALHSLLMITMINE